MNKIARNLLIVSSSALLAGCNTAHLSHTLREVHRNIDKLTEEGVEVDLNVTNLSSDMTGEGENFSGRVHVGGLGDVLWAQYNAAEEGEEAKIEGVAIKHSNKEVIQYTYNAETDEYDYESKYELEEGEFDSIKQMVYFALGYANTVQGVLQDAGTDVVAGRPCHKYTFAFNNILAMFGAEADIDIYVDDETGITLKAAHSIYVAAQEDTEFTFEVLQLKTEGVLLPTLNEPVEEPVEEEPHVEVE